MRDIKYIADAWAEKRFGVNTFAEPYGNTGNVVLFNAILLPNIIVGSFAYDTTLGNFHVIDDVAQGPFSITKTYEIITPESAEAGLIEQSGYLFEDASRSFGEVIDLLRECNHLSSTHIDSYTWASTEPEQDYFTGNTITYHLFIRDEHGETLNPVALSRLYRLAGLIK